MTNSEKSEVIKKKINLANKILVVASKPVDYDSLGTALAARWLLLKQGKEVDAKIFEIIPEHIKHFPGIENIVQSRIDEVDFKMYDLIITVDGNNFTQFFTKNYESYLKVDELNIVNIDHHEPDQMENLGDLSLREKDCATAKVLYDFFIVNSGIELDKDAANWLYFGLIGDTGVFKFAASPQIFSFASKLLEAGADHFQAANWDVPKYMIDYLVWAIANTKYFPESKLTILTLDKEKLKAIETLFGKDWDTLDLDKYYKNIFMTMVQGYPYSVILKVINDNVTRISWRTSNYGADINLMKLFQSIKIDAKGHIKAGGGSANFPIAIVEKMMVEALKNQN